MRDVLPAKVSADATKGAPSLRPRPERTPQALCENLQRWHQHRQEEAQQHRPESVRSRCATCARQDVRNSPHHWSQSWEHPSPCGKKWLLKNPLGTPQNSFAAVSKQAQVISPTACRAFFSARTTPQPSQNLVEPRWNPGGTLVEPYLRAAPNHPGAYLG